MKYILLLFAAAGLLSAQAHVTFSAPSYVPKNPLPACGAYPFDIGQTATYTFTTWNCSGIAIGSGIVEKMGTGYCSGFGGYCAITIGGPTAPQFRPDWTNDATQTKFAIYVTTWSINTGSDGLQGYGCGTTHVASTVPTYRSKPNCSTSPIVFDSKDLGFHLTGAEHGTLFREQPDGPLVRMSWLDPQYGNGWLVQPNLDGSWDPMSLARNLFGNLSPQAAGGEPNGYRALKLLATQNGCGEVDHIDALNCHSVWDLLRVWTDNGDGVVQPGELHTLASLGYTSIGLKYHSSPFTDAYGDQFRYTARVRDDQGREKDRSFDVFLAVQQ